MWIPLEWANRPPGEMAALVYAVGCLVQGTRPHWRTVGAYGGGEGAPWGMGRIKKAIQEAEDVRSKCGARSEHPIKVEPAIKSRNGATPEQHRSKPKKTGATPEQAIKVQAGLSEQNGATPEQADQVGVDMSNFGSHTLKAVSRGEGKTEQPVQVETGLFEQNGANSPPPPQESKNTPDHASTVKQAGATPEQPPQVEAPQESKIGASVEQANGHASCNSLADLNTKVNSKIPSPSISPKAAAGLFSEIPTPPPASLAEISDAAAALMRIERVQKVDPQDPSWQDPIMAIWHAWLKQRPHADVVPDAGSQKAIHEAVRRGFQPNQLVMVVEWWGGDTSPKGDPAYWRKRDPGHSLYNVFYPSKLPARIQAAAAWSQRQKELLSEEDSEW